MQSIPRLEVLQAASNTNNSAHGNIMHARDQPQALSRYSQLPDASITAARGPIPFIACLSPYNAMQTPTMCTMRLLCR